MTLDKLLQEKRAKILEIAAKHGAYNVRLFGSAARGEAGEGSDVDLLVEVGETHSPWFPAGLKLELEALLGSKVDIVTEGALHWAIRDEVLESAEPL